MEGLKLVKEYPPELRQLMARASSGDQAVVPALREAFDLYPELADLIGDMAKHAELALLALVAGDNVLAREAITRKLEELRAKLGAAADTELDKLLVVQVALDWLALQHAQLDLAGQLKSGSSGPAVKAAERRLDGAHGRFMSASKTLATVRKLLARVPAGTGLLRPAAGLRVMQTDAPDGVAAAG